MSLDEKIEKAVAGSILIDLAAKDSDNGRRELFDYERQLIEDSFTVEQNSPDFRTTYVNALRLALQTKNHHLVEILLGKDHSHDVFKDESDILQIAIRAYHGGIGTSQPESEFLKTLITYGASVNSFDNEGKSPLYYTCAQGLPETFKFLVESGADSSALFDPFPTDEIDNPPAPNAEGLEKENLLQIALNARQQSEKGNSIAFIWKKRVERWEPIVMYLLDAGQYCPLNNPSLVKFLHISCYQGNFPRVEKLLDFGVDHTARAGRSNPKDGIFGTALHVAAMMGQRDIAACLLRHGADPCVKYMCTPILGQEKVMMTPVELAFTSTPISSPIPDEQNILEVCEMLVDYGADKQDSLILLEGCIKGGNAAMLKRLLNKGIRIQEIPICSETQVVRLLLDYAYQIDFAKFQSHAVKQGLVDLMRFLVSRVGPLLPSGGDFGSIASRIIRGNHLDMLRYLVCEYGLDVNGIFPPHPGANTHINLLQLACDRHRLDLVELLLELGADVDCPGLPETILVHFRKHLQPYGNNSGSVATKMPIIRLLLHYSREKLEARVAADPMDATDSETKSKGQQVKSIVGRFSTYQDFLNLKDIKSLNAAAQSRQSVHFTADQRYGGPTEQEDPEPAATISVAEAYAGTKLLLEEERRQPIQYHPLNGLQSIRIVELEPAKSIDDPIRGRLIQMNLTQKPHYDALSYARGHLPKMVCILLEDKIFEVAETLWLALRRLRYEDKPRYIWIDAVSLDQENMREQNQQVTLMRDIYQMADQVLVWLGEEADDSHLIFEHLKKWKEYCEDYKAGRVESRDPCINESHLKPPPYDGKTRDAFLKLCQRPWFFRCWAIQEVSVAKHATIICGADTETFELLICPSGFTNGNTYHPLQAIEGPSHYHNLNEIRSQVRRNSIKDIIRYSRIFEVSDPRDKVYSLLGIFKRQMIPIDYALSIADIYRTFTQAIIEETQTLEVLHWTGSQRSRDDLGSWVPNFSVCKPVGVLPRVYGTWRHSTNYPTRLLPGFRFDTAKILVKGKYVDAVQDIGPELKASVANIPGSDGFSETLYYWECLATKLMSQKRFKYAVTGAFLDTLIADDQHWMSANANRPEFSQQAADFGTWYQRYCTYVLAEADPEYFQDVGIIQEWSNEQKTTELDKERGVAMFARSMEMACYGRSFFITDYGSMGLAPPRAQPGDELVYFPGGLYPFIVRKQEGGTYELIGDCFLYAFDIYQLFDDNSKEIKEYVLR